MFGKAIQATLLQAGGAEASRFSSLLLQVRAPLASVWASWPSASVVACWLARVATKLAAPWLPAGEPHSGAAVDLLVQAGRLHFVRRGSKGGSQTRALTCSWAHLSP